MKFKITVGIITYNRLHYLPYAVNSVLKQKSDYSFEVIIVDDGSTDMTKSYLYSLIDPRVRVIFHKNNQGIPQARNTVIENMQGEFLVWLDDDDVFTEETIDSHIKCLEQHPDVDIIYGKVYLCNEKLILLGEYKYKLTEPFVIHNFIFTNVISNSGTLIRKTVFNRIGNYDLSFYRGEDYDFWVRAAYNSCKFYANNNFVCYYRERKIKYVYNAENVRIVKKTLLNVSLEQIFTMYSWKTEPIKFKAYSLTTLAIIFYKYGDLESAISNNLKAVNLYPNEITSAFMRILYEANGELEKAKMFPQNNPYIQNILLTEALSFEPHELEIKLRQGLR